MLQPTVSSVSTIAISTSRRRTTSTALRVLSFIHRFRLVTTRHVQVYLQHASITPTHKQLQLLRVKGLIDRHYTATDLTANRPASYFLTPKGLDLLKAHAALPRYRRIRSLEADKSASLQRRLRYHTLADAYVHCKRHYNGHFQFFTAFDIAPLDAMPEEIPDGYVRLHIPGTPEQHYFVEIYGWGRSTQTQRRRLYSYLQFAESSSDGTTNTPLPHLFLIATSSNAQDRVSHQLRAGLRESLADGLKCYTTVANKLDGEETAIWRTI